MTAELVAPRLDRGAIPTPVLELAGIAKRFGGVQALEGVDFTLERGEVHGLVGENGAGKSTLMKIIAGVHTDYEGEMRIDGLPVRFRSTRDALRNGIGMVHQELSTVPDLTVAENVFLGSQPVNRLGFVRWRRMAEQAKQQLDALGISVDPTARLGSLPLGLQQLVEIGRVLFSGARIVILDEPTSALSPPEVRRLFDVLGRLKAQGTSFVFISHFLEDILEVSDSVTVFRSGRKVGDARAAEVDKGWLIHQMIGGGHEELEEAYTGEIELRSPHGATAALEATGLTLPGAFAGVDFDVKAGEVLGVYGFMGSGQLELARTLFGKTPPRSGTLRIGGTPVSLRNTTAAKRAGIAYVPESRRSMLFGTEPLYKNMSITVLGRISKLWLKPDQECAIGERHVKSLGIRPPQVDRVLRTLSGGNQQKVGLAKWLTDLPKVLILSEPTRGMDVGAKDDVVKIVRGVRDQGVAVIVVSTEPETVLSLADRILVMKRGGIAREFANETVSKDRLLAAA
jgi:ribose transport system ATP-binding protein